MNDDSPVPLLLDSRLKLPVPDFKIGRALYCGRCHHPISKHRRGRGVGKFGRYAAQTKCSEQIRWGQCSCERAQTAIRNNFALWQQEEYHLIDTIARQFLGMPCQHAIHYLFATEGFIYLGAELRLLGTITDLNAVRLHRDDVSVFLSRFRQKSVI